ncbi:hypothetical protein EGJ55_27060 [Pseudomonas moraviensis]|nr:hypothetical protein EGJ55_27060 [Pseudomonas moraviensis]
MTDLANRRVITRTHKAQKVLSEGAETDDWRYLYVTSEPVGASLLAKGPAHSTHALTDQKPSRAGSLPQEKVSYQRAFGVATLSRR